MNRNVARVCCVLFPFRSLWSNGPHGWFSPQCASRWRHRGPRGPWRDACDPSALPPDPVDPGKPILAPIPPPPQASAAVRAPGPGRIAVEGVLWASRCLRVRPCIGAEGGASGRLLTRRGPQPPPSRGRDGSPLMTSAPCFRCYSRAVVMETAMLGPLCEARGLCRRGPCPGPCTSRFRSSRCHRGLWLPPAASSLEHPPSPPAPLLPKLQTGSGSAL